jgi:DNA polymerase-1
MIRTDDYIYSTKKKSRIVLNVHDSIMIEAPEDEIDVMTPKLVEFMTQDIPRVTIDLKVDAAILDRWGK